MNRLVIKGRDLGMFHMAERRNVEAGMGMVAEYDVTLTFQPDDDHGVAWAVVGEIDLHCQPNDHTVVVWVFYGWGRQAHAEAHYHDLTAADIYATAATAGPPP